MNRNNFSAKTLQEAITKACVELGVTSDMLDYSVMEQGSAGILGIGARPWVISACSKAELEAEQEAKRLAEEKAYAEKKAAREAKEREAQLRKVQEEQNAAGFKTAEEKVIKDKNASKAFESKSATEAKVAEKRTDDAKAVVGKASAAQATVKRVADAKAVYVTEGKKILPDTDHVEAAEEKTDASGEKEFSMKAPASQAAGEEAEKKATAFLKQVFDSIGMEVEIKTHFDEMLSELDIDLSGEEMGVLIGKRGQTLNSLQYLIGQIINKHSSGYIRVKLDTENYRQRRQDTLESLAHNMADKVRRTRHAMALEPMNPYERRIIHSTLQDEKDVFTRSEGEEPYRHVVVCYMKHKK